ncbi:serine hydrolase domain-containing protein [Neobacillus sp. D3-1R]|uniref:serine hydrolase domain-containing protein n=1 Tax=Neobacillus sp. D3-1R TaxID=3445778 RepID=UPI003F9F846E
MKKQVLYFAVVIGMLSGCTVTSVDKPENNKSVVTVQGYAKGETPEKPPNYWPTMEWKTSLPEQQGMNSKKLADLFEKLDEINSPLDGLIIIRNGYIVAEKYGYGYGPERSHEINSVTKSFMSAVTGVAINEGYIKSIDDPIFDYFPDRKAENMDDHKKNLTVKDFLTMNSGLDWGELDKDRKHQFWSDFESTDDTVQFVLNKPTDPNLIGKFDYNTGLPHILSAIVQQTTGKKTADYAKEKIFDKIGITTAYWPEVQGVNQGGYRMEMTPRDMARFGYLYMNNGKWDGQQVVPEDWVKTSMSELIQTGMTGGEHYGYYFWLTTTKDGYKEISAMGDRGQYIVMVPELNLLVVQTSKAYLTDINIFEEYIYPAAESTEPIPVDAESNTRLSENKKK